MVKKPEDGIAGTSLIARFVKKKSKRTEIVSPESDSGLHGSSGKTPTRVLWSYRKVSYYVGARGIARDGFGRGLHKLT